jgi:preprotein translocase subunit SecG
MLQTFLDIVHIFVCVFLMLVVLLQQGKGGGMGAAFGGAAAQQVFGGRGAGNILTRATAICAGIFMLTSVSLAYLSSTGDRDLRARVIEEQKKKGKGNEGAPRAGDSSSAKPPESTSGAPPTNLAPEQAPAPDQAPAPQAPSSTP